MKKSGAASCHDLVTGHYPGITSNQCTSAVMLQRQKYDFRGQLEVTHRYSRDGGPRLRGKRYYFGIGQGQRT